MPANERTPQSEALDIVMLGSFNAAILHPQWFLRQNLIGEEEALNAAVKVVSSQVTDASFAGVQIVCLSNQLTLSTANVAFAPRLLDITRGILNALPYTPVTACGINPSAHYGVDGINYWHKIGDCLAPKTEVWNPLFSDMGRPGLQHLTIRTTVTDGALNITIEPSTLINPGIYVRANTHFGVPEGARDRGADAVREFIDRKSAAAEREARRVAEKIFAAIRPDA